MLPASSRLHCRTDFEEVVRHGRRAGRTSLVVHLLAPEGGPDAGDSGMSRVGFIVSRQVGNSVRRHEVTRRLRHLMRDRIQLVPAGSRVVVRARPTAAGRTSVELARELDGSLSRLSGAGR
jgi:ribonuclease P protein component